MTDKAMEYFVWCDESVQKGKYYSNFFGGLLVASNHLEKVNHALSNAIEKSQLTDELKWQKVNAFHFEKYKIILDVFFKLVKQNKIKVRIMFTHNAMKAKGLQNHHAENEYFLLYYQFFKHAFGFEHSNKTTLPIHVRAYFDNMPDTLTKRQQFKEYIKGLESLKKFNDAKIRIRKQDIAEVNSKEHIMLQLLDIVLGAMAFRLNNMHKEKPEGKKRRGKRTI